MPTHGLLLCVFAPLRESFFIGKVKGPAPAPWRELVHSAVEAKVCFYALGISVFRVIPLRSNRVDCVSSAAIFRARTILTTVSREGAKAQRDEDDYSTPLSYLSCNSWSTNSPIYNSQFLICSLQLPRQPRFSPCREPLTRIAARQPVPTVARPHSCGGYKMQISKCKMQNAN